MKSLIVFGASPDIGIAPVAKEPALRVRQKPCDHCRAAQLAVDELVAGYRLLTYA